MKVRAFKRLLSQMNKLTRKQVKRFQYQLNQKNAFKIINSLRIKVEYCTDCGNLNFSDKFTVQPKDSILIGVLFFDF